jgi:hypothetical protein
MRRGVRDVSLPHSSRKLLGSARALPSIVSLKEAQFWAGPYSVLVRCIFRSLAARWFEPMFFERCPGSSLCFLSVRCVFRVKRFERMFIFFFLFLSPFLSYLFFYYVFISKFILFCFFLVFFSFSSSFYDLFFQISP